MAQAPNATPPVPTSPAVASGTGQALANLPRFFREVRGELRRVTWPSAADTRRMTLMVFILVSIVALFLLSVDLLIGLGLSYLFDLKL
jgi:preprotein translocase subunit SecE